MKTKFFLHVKQNGSTKTTKSKTTTYVDEISIAMELDLPDSLFEKPIISGKIKVTEDMVNPPHIDADVKEALENAISSVQGVELKLLVEEPVTNPQHQ